MAFHEEASLYLTVQYSPPLSNATNTDEMKVTPLDMNVGRLPCLLYIRWAKLLISAITSTDFLKILIEVLFLGSFKTNS